MYAIVIAADSERCPNISVYAGLAIQVWISSIVIEKR